MIAFSCAHCGMKLKVHDQFAGRPSKCPTCKQPLVVPPPSATVPYIPPQQIDGTESGLAKAGLNGGVTLLHDPTGRQPNARFGPKPQRSVGEALAQRQKNTQRFVVEGEIARGGMGAVLRAVDCDLRREIAVKFMLDDKDQKKKARFIEEAQINSQLEHPNIVPVYDLGIDAQKRPFIMMKMVKGKSLKDVLDQLRDNPKQAEKDYSLGRLLNILVNVCNALAFAHARGVIHRDLKPANIMLGDFGEVYVMDWGLAKVLNQSGAADTVAVPAQAAMAPSAADASISARNSSVATSRGPEADLTQEGSVLGTPVYMPPEQATGNLNAIDQRSDVYSLGAILYEMLTMQPPVSREGGHLNILMQVMQGQIIPPQQREPKRARAGKIPNELAAVAMKALAKEKENRYPTADALRQDIERFQEGRSVSAKEDTRREALWRLVKRNKVASAFTALLAVVLVWSSWTNFQARRAMEQAQEEQRKQAKDAVPALVQAIKMMIAEGLVDEAMIQATAAVEADPDHADARLLKAQLLLANREFTAADQDLTRCLQLRPDHAEARKLLDLCRKTRPEDAAALLVLAEDLSRQQRFALANRLTKATQGMVKSREQLLDHYRKRIDTAWAGLGGLLSQDGSGKLALNLRQTKVENLTPLQGMPLTTLYLSECNQVRDLTPLRGMPLTTLWLWRCRQVRDLTPLTGMPLTTLHLGECDQLRDLTPLHGLNLTDIQIDPRNITKGIEALRGMSSLKRINGVPSLEFWKRYDAGEFK